MMGCRPCGSFGGTSALVSIVLACTHGRSTEISRPTVAQPTAVVLVGEDGALVLDARRVSDAELDRVTQTNGRAALGRNVTIAGATDARHGDVLRALEVVARAAPGPITLAAPDLHPLTAFPRSTGEVGASRPTHHRRRRAGVARSIARRRRRPVGARVRTAHGAAPWGDARDESARPARSVGPPDASSSARGTPFPQSGEEWSRRRSPQRTVVRRR